MIGLGWFLRDMAFLKAKMGSNLQGGARGRSEDRLVLHVMRWLNLPRKNTSPQINADPPLSPSLTGDRVEPF